MTVQGLETLGWKVYVPPLALDEREDTKMEWRTVVSQIESNIDH